MNEVFLLQKQRSLFDAKGEVQFLAIVSVC